jgi:hypothetical protein
VISTLVTELSIPRPAATASVWEQQEQLFQRTQTIWRVYLANFNRARNGHEQRGTTVPPVEIPGVETISVRRRSELYELWRTVLAAHNLGPTWTFSLWELCIYLSTERSARV